MDVCLVIKERLDHLHLEQKDLASAAEVTESYISQLLTRKKLPPASTRTDIYEKMERFLKLPSGKLARLADLQRNEALKRGLEHPPAPLFGEARELILRKCSLSRREQVRSIFEKQPFGEIERFVTQQLLDVAKDVARQSLHSEKWLQSVARLSGRSYKQMRVVILEFLDMDVFHVSAESCVVFLEPVIESWDIDLSTLAMDVVLNRKLAPGPGKRFEFVERARGDPAGEEPGLTEFLRNAALLGNATQEEIEFLKSLKFKGRRPTALYYYRELQNLRDPLHFSSEIAAPRRPLRSGAT
jgi:transcriptional regulator with XRE-family HTH domain